MRLKSKAEKWKAALPAVFLSLKDDETPCAAKLLAAVTVAYALSPIDLIPDFIPLLGYLDDLVLLPALVALTVRCIPKRIWEKNLALAAGLWKDGKPKKWFYAIPVVIAWLLIIGLAVKAIWF